MRRQLRLAGTQVWQLLLVQHGRGGGSCSPSSHEPGHLLVGGACPPLLQHPEQGHEHIARLSTQQQLLLAPLALHVLLPSLQD